MSSALQPIVMWDGLIPEQARQQIVREMHTHWNDFSSQRTRSKQSNCVAPLSSHTP